MSNLFPKLKERFGVGFDFSATNDVVQEYKLDDLADRIWFYDYSYSPHANGGTSFGESGTEGMTGQPSDYPNQYQMIWNAKNYSNGSGTSTIGSVAARYTGRKWLIGNEPDGAGDGQSKNTPQEYANGYRHIYKSLKESDPTCFVYFGGVSCLSPQRKRWLDQMLSSYSNAYGSALPCDGFHAHAYLLPETGSFGLGSAWGVSGGTADARTEAEYWIDYTQNPWVIDHLNPVLYKEDTLTMRTWLYTNGYASKPFIMSEYGCLYDSTAVTGSANVYMQDTFEHNLTAYDSIVGCPNDDLRLVQEFAWFSANFDVYDWPTMFERANKKLSSFGSAYRQFYVTNYGDLSLETEGSFELCLQNLDIFQLTEKADNFI